MDKDTTDIQILLLHIITLSFFIKILVFVKYTISNNILVEYA